MEEEIYENDYEKCEYCEVTYWESDTGYREYGCSLITGNERESECLGGDIHYGCPLSFKYQIENKSGTTVSCENQGGKNEQNNY